jgi:hypothetical protein
LAYRANAAQRFGGYARSREDCNRPASDRVGGESHSIGS